MKILVACERVDAEGGIESYLRTVLPALSARGHDVLAIARSATQPDAFGVPTHEIVWPDEHDPPSHEAAETAAQVVAGFAPDVVAIHAVLDAAVLETLLAGAPRTVVHLHDHRVFCPNGDRRYPQGEGLCGVPMGQATCGWHALVSGCAYGPRPSTVRLVARRQRVARGVRAAGAVIAFSHYMADLAIRNGVAAQRVRVLAPPLPVDAFAAEPAPRPRLDRVLLSGRMVAAKGVTSLLGALRQIPEARRPQLWLAGDGPELQPAVDRATYLGIACVALGRLSPAQVREALDASTIAVMPSLWGEPFGLAGIEALARGRPVAGYDSGAIGEWLDPDAGALVPRGDESALADALVALLQPERWEACARAGLTHAQRYALEPHLCELERIYAGESAATRRPETAAD